MYYSWYFCQRHRFEKVLEILQIIRFSGKLCLNDTRKCTRVVCYYTTNAARTVSKQYGAFCHLIGWVDICFNEQLIWCTTWQWVWLQDQSAGSFDFFVNTHWLVYVSVFMLTGEVAWHHCGRWSHLDTRWVVNLEFHTQIQLYIHETTVN